MISQSIYAFGKASALVFTGQTASCNASPGARTTRPVVVVTEQTIRGKSFTVKAKPGDPTKTKVKASASEKASPNTLVGDPTASGASLEIVVDGGTPASQHFVLAQGTSSRGKPFWSGDAVKGFKYQDKKGDQGAVKAVSIKLKNAKLTLEASLPGTHGPISILPPAPGTAACVALQLGGDGDRYSVQFGPESKITNKGDRLFKASNPQTEGVCPSGPPPTTTSTTVPATTTTSTTLATTTTSTTLATTTTSTTVATTTTTSTTVATTTITTSTTTTTTAYGSPSRAFLTRPVDLLD